MLPDGINLSSLLDRSRLRIAEHGLETLGVSDVPGLDGGEEARHVFESE